MPSHIYNWNIVECKVKQAKSRNYQVVFMVKILPTVGSTFSVRLHIYVPSHIWLKYRWMLSLTTNKHNQTKNVMTLIPSLTFIEFEIASMEHLQRVWLASRECLPFWTPGSVPLFWDMPMCRDQISRTRRVSRLLFALNTPRHFPDFACFTQHSTIFKFYMWRHIEVQTDQRSR